MFFYFKEHFLIKHIYKPGSVVDSHLSRTYITICLKPPFQKMASSLSLPFRCCSRWGLHWPKHVTIPAVSSYLTFSPLPFTRRLFSVALSLRFPSLDVIQHHCSVEPGLSSYAVFRPCYTRLSNLLLFILTSFT